MKNLKEIIHEAVSDAIEMEELICAIRNNAEIDYDQLAQNILDIIDVDEIAADIVSDWL